MPRQVRVQFERATYHVMCRGNHQEPVFNDDRDCETFLDTLGEACGRCGWRVHAFCLMGNHYHLLLETPEANLVDGMRWLQGTYTQRFNARHKVWGHLFQSRYKALLVDSDGDYFSTVASYIHLNPARARCFNLECGKLTDYKQSSYPGYVRPAKRPEWLVVDRVLGSHGFKNEASGRAGYRNYMQKRVLEIFHSDDPMKADEKWVEIRRGWLFGSEEFRLKMQDVIDGAVAGNRRDSYSGDAVKRHDEHAAGELLEKALRKLKLKRTDLGRLQKADDRKKVIAWLVRSRTSVKNEWIASSLSMGHPSTVSRGVGAVEKAEDGLLWEFKNEISKFKD